jgi:hypothetical protein
MSQDNGQSTPKDQPEQEDQPAPGTPPPPQGPQFNPQSAHPVGEPGTPPPYPPSNPYAAQQAYPQQPYPQQPYQPGMPQFPSYVLPDHPKATSALVVGLIAVAGTFLCGLPVLASPVAWVLGAQARNEIRRSPQQWGGEGKATAGMVLGIIGTVLLVLIIVVITLVVVIAINDPSSFNSDTSV